MSPSAVLLKQVFSFNERKAILQCRARDPHKSVTIINVLADARTQTDTLAVFMISPKREALNTVAFNVEV